MSDKKKFPLEVAHPVARWMEAALAIETKRIIIAGSIRRAKPMVGDIEILYIPEFGYKLGPPKPGDLFPQPETYLANLVDEKLDRLIEEGVLEKRLNLKKQTTWGEKIKLGIHKPSGIPIDFFSTSEESWWNYLVCRTGPAEFNTRIATLAQQKGMKWEPYSSGFVKEGGARIHCHSEEDVLEAVDLPWLPPEKRQ